MKLRSKFLLIVTILLGERVYSQSATINLSVKDMPLVKVFNSITEQSGYRFFYDNAILSGTKSVTLEIQNITVENALKICLKDQPLVFKIFHKTISIKKKDQKEGDVKQVVQPTIGIIIHGQVTDTSDAPLVGASVFLKKNRGGTQTDLAGKFSLIIPDEMAVLIISFTGFKTTEYKLGKETNFKISLQPNPSSLDEIQVIAYGTTSKRLNTGNVTSIKSSDIEKQPVSNPLLALEGRVPGMFIEQSTGQPGAGVSVQIRGQNSISNGNNPLYIIDGVPYSDSYIPSLSEVLGGSTTVSGLQTFTSGSPFSYINPADIESIDILKDADATAIYGTRGANGVVLITTKRGKAGQTNIDFNLQNGYGKVPEKMKMLNTTQYLEMRHEAFKNDGAVPSPNADYDLTLWDTTRNTDWQKQLLEGTAQYTDLQGTVSGGNSNTQFLIAANYHGETTVFPGNFSDQKGGVHFNVNNVSADQKFRISLSGLYSLDNNQLCGFDLTEQALQLAPDAPPMYNKDGSINWAEDANGVSTWPGYNPAAMQLPQYQTKTNNLVSNSVISYRLFPGLEIKSSFGYTNTSNNQVQTVPLAFYSPSLRSFEQRKSTFSNFNLGAWIIEPQISYTKNISEGKLSFLVGTTIQQNINTGEIFNATGFNSDLVLEDIKSASAVTVVSTLNTVYKYNAIFGRLNYNWKDKYLINATTRRDGSSRFGPENQFHDFGAVGLGWIISKERFIEENIKYLSFAKLRGSFGTTGSDQVGDYTFMDLYVPSSFGVPYQGAVGNSPNRIYTPNLSWEETTKLEAGLELGFIKDRVIFTGSYYRNRSSNQLTGYLLPAITGFTTVEKNLGAVVQNTGWEFELKTENVKTKYFSWSTSFNLSLNRNKLLSGAPGLSDHYKAKIGHPLSSIFVYQFLGVNTITGLYQVADKNGKATLSPNPSTDATVLINQDPKFYGGFENSFEYKGFQLDFLFQFVKSEGRNYLASFPPPGYFNGSFGGNQPVGLLNRWQMPGDVRPFERYSQNLSVYQSWVNAQNSNMVYSDDSFIRLKNISFSWQLKKEWLRDIHLRNARIYAQGQNLLTFTKFKGLDPGVGYGVVPPLRIITGGIQFSL